MFANIIGDDVPVRVRLKEVNNGLKRWYFSYDKYTLIPPTFTWHCLRDEYTIYTDHNAVGTPRPSESSFLRILTKRCPTVSDRLEIKFARSAHYTETVWVLRRMDWTPKYLVINFRTQRR